MVLIICIGIEDRFYAFSNDSNAFGKVSGISTGCSDSLFVLKNVLITLISVESFFVASF